MDKMIKKTITGIGPVSFRKVTIKVIANAHNSAAQLELPEKAHVFTNHVVAGAIIKPAMTPNKIKLLPANTQREVVDSVVELLCIEKQYSGIEEDDVHLKFYNAFREYESTLFSGLFENLKPVLGTSSFQLHSFLRSLPEFFAAQREMFDQIRGLFEALPTKWGLTSAFPLSIVSSIKSFNFAGIFKEFEIQIRSQKEAENAFRVAGWAIAPSMPEYLIEHVVEMHKQGKARYISRTIMGYYQSNNSINLKNAVDAWSTNPYFSPRMKIIKDALWAHCEGLYTLSYPAIVPQIEGVLRSYVYNNSLLDKNNNHKLAKVCEAATDDYDLSNWLIATALLYQLENNIYTYKAFEKELRKANASRSITRHTTLHGIAYNYDRQIHSLKAFLLLDAVFGLAVQLDK